MNTLIEICNRFDIPLVSDQGNIDNIDKFVDNSRNIKDNIEGFIIRFDNGSMYKMKTDQYVLLFKTMNNISSEINIIQTIVNGTIDDLKSIMNKDMLELVEIYENKFISNIHSYANNIFDIFSNYVSKNENSTKKEFADYVNKNKFKDPKFLFMLYDKYYHMNITDFTELKKILFSMIIVHIEFYSYSSSRIDMVRHIFGNIEWKSLMFTSE